MLNYSHQARFSTKLGTKRAGFDAFKFDLWSYRLNAARFITLTPPTASLSVDSLSDVALGPLLAAFWGVLSIFVNLSLPRCAWRALLGKSFCVSDAVGHLLRNSG